MDNQKENQSRQSGVYHKADKAMLTIKSGRKSRVSMILQTCVIRDQSNHQFTVNSKKLRSIWTHITT